MENYHGAIVHRHTGTWGVTLGKHIFVGKTAGEKTLRHEYGHYLQYQKLMVWYYLIIGLPSLIHCIWYEVTKQKGDYYSFFTEKWADKLSAKYFKAVE